MELIFVVKQHLHKILERILLRLFFKQAWLRAVNKLQTIAWLYYGKLLSPIVEDCFNDPVTVVGINALGTYSVKMKIEWDIPQYIVAV